MERSRVPEFLAQLLKRLGRDYPLAVLLQMQFINTLFMIILASILAHQNAEFNKFQANHLLIFATIVMLLKNFSLLVQFYYQHSDMFSRLQAYSSQQERDVTAELELRAWKQATAATKDYIFSEFIQQMILVLIPTLVYGFFILHLSIAQVVYLGVTIFVVSIINFIFENLTLDQWFEPIFQVLIPKQFEASLAGMRGMRLWTKLSITIVGLFISVILLVISTGYHQVQVLSASVSAAMDMATIASQRIMMIGIITIFLAGLISTRLIFYFSTPFQKLINVFKEVENGNLGKRMQVNTPDEFGELNIYFNHMITRLQQLTTSLEQQVAERTLKLSLSNEQLLYELAERKRIEEKLSYSALHDALSDLPNRTLFIDRLQHAIQHSKRHENYTYAVFFLDLDRFKVINDSLGHNVGDLLLIESARCLLNCVRSEDTVARLGGDEFVILIEDLESKADYMAIADRIQHDMAVPTDLEGHKVFVSVSMGIVLNTDHYNNPEDVLRDADIAMYRAKRNGRGCNVIFDSSMLDGAISRMELESDLRNALENDEFIIHYQPILDMRQNKITGFEALVRWQHPKRGLLLPAEFITTAEDMGLIIPLGYWVMDQSCRQLRVWQKAYPTTPQLTMNVNLSTRQFIDVNLVDKVAEILKKNQMNPGCLNLELTESILIEDSKSTSMILEQLRDLGTQVQIDDFGTGYSSLGYLNTLPIDTLKIDRSFIHRLGGERNGSDIVQMILALAHSLGMKVIAEGVETDDQFAILKGLDCEYMQGFLFAKAVDYQKATELLGKSSSVLG